MGESTDSRAAIHFDRSLRLKYHGATITSGAGLPTRAASLPAEAPVGQLFGDACLERLGSLR